MAADPNKWQKCKLPEDLQLKLLNTSHKIHCVNSTGFIIVYDTIIYKCNIPENKWFEWMKLEKDMIYGEYTTCIDIAKQLLYIINDNDSTILIVIIDLKSNQFQLMNCQDMW